LSVQLSQEKSVLLTDCINSASAVTTNTLDCASNLQNLLHKASLTLKLSWNIVGHFQVLLYFLSERMNVHYGSVYKTQSFIYYILYLINSNTFRFFLIKNW